jgi:glycosyltransferase involved in cell wall biosynthesis
MRLTCIIDSLVPGGAETSLKALAPHYVAKGVDLQVVYLKEQAGLQQELALAGASLLCAEGPGGRLGWVRRVASILRERRPDLVHTTLFEADVVGRSAARLIGIPVVTSLVNVQYGPEQFNDPRLKRWRLRGAQLTDVLTARSAARWHALTDHVADVMAPRLRISRERIDVIPRGRDRAVLGARTEARRQRVRAALGIRPHEKMVLAAARQEYQKGLDVLLAAWPGVAAAVPQSKLIVAGREGNESSRLQRMTSEIDPSVRPTFLGRRDDVPDLLVAADGFVLPSRWEGLGSVLIEAMALGVPMVASDLAPVREIVGSNAVLVQPDDPATLARGLEDCLSNQVRAEEMTHAARRRFEERFTIEVVADRMLNFYESALNLTKTKAEPVS